MRDTIEMAREAGFETMLRKGKILGFDRDGDYTEELKAFAKLVAAHERNKLAAWMIQFGFATGHGDTMEELVDELGTEIVDRIDGEVEAEREACAKVADYYATGMERNYSEIIADAIRARGETK
jgi:hypothetical protein